MRHRLFAGRSGGDHSPHTVEGATNMPDSTHNILHRSPALSWDDGLPLGNGVLGALVWGDARPLNISLDRTDLWDLRGAPEFDSHEFSYANLREWVRSRDEAPVKRLIESPYSRPQPTKVPAGRIALDLGAAFESAELNLRDATARVKLGSGELRLFVHATQHVGVILAGRRGPERASIEVPPFAAAPKERKAHGGYLGELASLGYDAPEAASGSDFAAYTQQGAGFRFTVYLGWRTTVTGWLGAWTIASSADGRDTFETARSLVASALAAGWERMYGTHRKWWEEYWTRSSVSLADSRMEAQYYRDIYKLGAASRPAGAPMALQGPWTADDGALPPWKGDYHHDLNTQMSYWPYGAANRMEQGAGFVDWLWDTREECRAFTKRFYGLPGLNVPGTCDLRNRPIGGWAPYSVASTTGAWLAQSFYRHWKLSADRSFLENRAYPYLSEAADFVDAITSERGADGKRTLPLSISPELHRNTFDAWWPTITNHDLALVRWLLGAAAETADAAGKPDEAARRRKALSEFPPLWTGREGLLVTKDAPLWESHRHHAHLMAIHPLGLVSWRDGEEARRLMKASLDHLESLGTGAWTGFSFAWLGAIAARCHDGARAARALGIFAEAFTFRSSFHSNGDLSGKGYSKVWSGEYGRIFTLEANMAFAEGVQEMLLSSHDGAIEVFPAVPAAWEEAAFESLRAEGGFLVSAERKHGKTTRVLITSERGGTCRVVSPFTGGVAEIALRAGQTIELA